MVLNFICLIITWLQRVTLILHCTCGQQPSKVRQGKGEGMLIDRSAVKRRETIEFFWWIGSDLISMPDNESHLNITKINWTPVLLLLAILLDWRRSRRRRIIMDGQGTLYIVVVGCCTGMRSVVRKSATTADYHERAGKSRLIILLSSQCVSLSRTNRWSCCKWMTLVTDVESIIRRLF